MADAIETDDLAAGQTAPTSGALRGEGEEVYTASQWRLMWWKFRKHKLAMVSLAMIATLYFVVVFCEFLAPYPLEHQEMGIFVRCRYGLPTLPKWLTSVGV